MRNRCLNYRFAHRPIQHGCNHPNHRKMIDYVCQLDQMYQLLEIQVKKTVHHCWVRSHCQHHKMDGQDIKESAEHGKQIGHPHHSSLVTV